MDFDSLSSAITQSSRYHQQLVLVTGSAASNLVNEYHHAHSVPLINLGIEFSESLLVVPVEDWPKKSAGLFTDLLMRQQSKTILLDRIEVIFDRNLALDPLKLLKANSKNKTLVAIWPGVKTATALTYAIPSHPEYRSYKQADFKEIAFLNAGVMQKETL
jgi:hypothetical protein